MLEYNGGDDCNDVLQEMPPHTCHAVLPPTLFVKGHGTKESVTGLLGQAGDGEGGRRGLLAHLSPQDQLRLFYPSLNICLIFIMVMIVIIVTTVRLLLSYRR